MHNKLSTLDRLAIRNPSLYKDFKKYVICLKENKNREHLFCCTGLMDMINQAWQEAIMSFKKKILTLHDRLSNKKKSNILSLSNKSFSAHPQISDQILEKILKLLEHSILKSQVSLLNFTLGLLDNNYTKKIMTILGKHQTTTMKIRDLLIQTSSKFRNLF